MAVKHRAPVNPLLQSLTSVLVNLSANYKVATWIKRSCYSPLFFYVGAERSRRRDTLTSCGTAVSAFRRSAVCKSPCFYFG